MSHVHEPSVLRPAHRAGPARGGQPVLVVANRHRQRTGRIPLGRAGPDHEPLTARCALPTSDAFWQVRCRACADPARGAGACVGVCCWIRATTIESGSSSCRPIAPLTARDRALRVRHPREPSADPGRSQLGTSRPRGQRCRWLTSRHRRESQVAQQRCRRASIAHQRLRRHHVRHRRRAGELVVRREVDHRPDLLPAARIHRGELQREPRLRRPPNRGRP
jgi:hypothetical protein